MTAETKKYPEIEEGKECHWKQKKQTNRGRKKQVSPALKNGGSTGRWITCKNEQNHL